MKRFLVIVGVVLIAGVIGALWRGGVFLPQTQIETGQSCIEPGALAGADVEFVPGPERSYEDQEIAFVCGSLVTLCDAAEARISIRGPVSLENVTSNRSVITVDALRVGSYEVNCSVGAYENTGTIERIERPADVGRSPWATSIVASGTST